MPEIVVQSTQCAVGSVGAPLLVQLGHPVCAHNASVVDVVVVVVLAVTLQPVIVDVLVSHASVELELMYFGVQVT